MLGLIHTSKEGDPFARPVSSVPSSVGFRLSGCWVTEVSPQILHRDPAVGGKVGAPALIVELSSIISP